MLLFFLLTYKDEKITLKEIAKKYLTEDQSTTGWFIAKEPKV